MRSVCTGESWVARPLPQDRFMEVVDPDFIMDYFCAVMSVPLPLKVVHTHGTKEFRGSYNFRLERLNYTQPYVGILLHELAHHICHKRGLNGRGNYHDHNFGEVLQDMIDLWI